MLHQFITSLAGTFISLFAIANPIGAIPIFYSLTADDTPLFRGTQARWTGNQRI